MTKIMMKLTLLVMFRIAMLALYLYIAYNAEKDGETGVVASCGLIAMMEIATISCLLEVLE